jgi:hypothetical protein
MVNDIAVLPAFLCSKKLAGMLFFIFARNPWCGLIDPFRFSAFWGPPSFRAMVPEISASS